MILDRIESGVAVLTDGGGKAFTCPAALLGNSPREDDAFEVTVAGGKIVSAAPAENGRAGENRERLKSLFKNKG